MIYPSEISDFYGTFTPREITDIDMINYETPCDISDGVIKIWNMNIPWSESPAGIFSSTTKDFTTYESKTFLGSKEYFGYQTNASQRFTFNENDTPLSSDTYFYNSFNEKIYQLPSDQKSIAAIHYSNTSIDLIYGEKFAMNPLDVTDNGATGQAGNFKLEIPWLLWHKTKNGKIGQTFYVDPPGYKNLNICHMLSEVNSDMNDPGLRYYHLWDLNENVNGDLNRIGKVFPDLKMIVIDDDEIIAAMSYKANRNWTLPSPRLSLIQPNVCDSSVTNDEGLLLDNNVRLWVTYRLSNTTSNAFTESLHCNYYSFIDGPSSGCSQDSKDVSIRFGSEFPFLNQPNGDCTYGFFAENLSLIVQKVTGTTRPDPELWLEIDVTSQLSGTSIGGYLTQSGITGTTFIVDIDSYSAGTIYDLSDYIEIPPTGDTLNCLNFGDEYYFYGNIKTDIEATIYEMRYAVDIPNQQFTVSTNPTWNDNKIPYISEIGIYDENKDLMFLTKLQSPQKRLSDQQFLIKIDF